MRDKGLVSTGPNLEKSTAGISGRAAPAAAPPETPPASAALTSSRVMRPFSPVPRRCVRSRSSSRARRRTAGPASTPEKSAGAGPAAGAGGAAAGAAGGAGTAAGAGGAGAAGAAPAPAAGSRRRISEPIATLSPTLATISRTVPAPGAGTSMVALSDSSVTSD